MRPAPRPYQEDAIEAVLAAFAAGRRRVLLTMATGTGKTNAFVWLIERMGLETPVLVLAHRDELIRQAAERIRALAPGLRVGIEKADERAPEGSHVVVASIQTIGREGSRRLEWLKPGLIICDEAHHAPATSYMTVFDRFGCFRNDGALLLGVTATPHRQDARRMATVFEEEVFRYDILPAMKDGWLCPIRCYRVVTGTDISGVKTSQGDFDVGALAEAVNTRARTEQVIEHWREVADGRRTLAFCASVDHAHDTAHQFRDAGIPAEAVDGGMPMDERRAILNRLRSGKTLVVPNCAVLTEGFDCPEISAVVMLRPTQSAALYTQQAGRGTRVAPGKRDLILIDVVDNCRRHSLVTAPALLGLPTNLDIDGGTLVDAADVVERLGAGAGVLLGGDTVTLDELRTKLKEWDVFAQIALPDDAARATRLAWSPVPGGFFLSGGKDRSARIVCDILGEYSLEIGSRQVDLGTDLLQALRRADNLVLREWADARLLILNNAAWRCQPATEKQVAFLRKKGFPPHVLAELTKGQAALAITQAIGA
jgi:superfamily II DNA or RNA helicase